MGTGRRARLPSLGARAAPGPGPARCSETTTLERQDEVAWDQRVADEPQRSEARRFAVDDDRLEPPDGEELRFARRRRPVDGVVRSHGRAARAELVGDDVAEEVTVDLRAIDGRLADRLDPVVDEATIRTRDDPHRPGSIRQPLEVLAWNDLVASLLGEEIRPVLETPFVEGICIASEHSDRVALRHDISLRHTCQNERIATSLIMLPGRSL